MNATVTEQAARTCIQCGRGAKRFTTKERCSACYQRFMRGDTSPSKPRSPDLAPDMAELLLSVEGASETFSARVLNYIDASGDCWQWTGACDRQGYGIISRGGKVSYPMLAHRAVWLLLVGPIPDGLVYDHLCRNRPCVNPDHGELVTPGENTRRGYGLSVTYSLRTTCKYGHPLDGVRSIKGGKPFRFCRTCKRNLSGVAA